jgi:hypothetical protein
LAFAPSLFPSGVNVEGSNDIIGSERAGLGIAALDLQRDMLDAEFLVQVVTGSSDRCIFYEIGGGKTRPLSDKQATDDLMRAAGKTLPLIKRFSFTPAERPGTIEFLKAL